MQNIAVSATQAYTDIGAVRDLATTPPCESLNESERRGGLWFGTYALSLVRVHAIGTSARRKHGIPGGHRRPAANRTIVSRSG